MKARKTTAGLFLMASLVPVLAFPLGATAAETMTAGGDYPTTPDHPMMRDRYFFALGAYYPRTSTSAKLDPNTGTGVVVDFEDALGLEDQKWVFQSAFRWRFSERWRLEVDYFSLNRPATRVLQKTVDWGNQTFPIGATVNTQFKTSDLRAAVGYSFFRRQDKELGAGFGLHSSKFDVSIDSSGGQAQATDVTAPLPVVNLYAQVAFTNTWLMSTRIDWLSLSYGDYSGDVRNVALDFIYQPWRTVGFGFGVHNLLYNLEMNSSSWHGKVDIQFQGPAAFMTFSF